MHYEIDKSHEEISFVEIFIFPLRFFFHLVH